MSEEMIGFLVMIVSSAVGTLGVVLAFGVEKRAMLWAVLASVLCCFAYDVTRMLGVNLLIASMIGSGVATMYSYVVARLIKVPVTVMIIPGIIILVPGGKLYYTMLGILNSDMDMFARYGKDAMLIAAGLAIGIIAVTTISRPINAQLISWH